jgi:hypothetical protein
LKALQSDFFVVLLLQVQITKTRAGPKGYELEKVSDRTQENLFNFAGRKQKFSTVEEGRNDPPPVMVSPD